MKNIALLFCLFYSSLNTQIKSNFTSIQNNTKKVLPINQTLKNKIGLELYSVRRELQTDVPGTLQKVKAMGINEVEIGSFFGYTAEGFKKALADAGLKPTSMLVSYEQVRDSLDVLIQQCKLFGIHYLGTAWIPHDKSFTREEAVNAANLFNKAGAQLKQNGIHFFYHAHGYEFLPTAQGTLFDLMAGIMNKGVADFQLDVFWVTRGGANPTALLNKYPHRFLSLHLKDLAKGYATNDSTGTAPDVSSVVLGKGQIDWKSVLNAAIKNGVQQYFIEDESEDAMKQIPQTLQYLHQLK